MTQGTKQTIGALTGMLVGLAYCVRMMIENRYGSTVFETMNVLDWGNVPWDFRFAMLAVTTLCTGLGWAVANTALSNRSTDKK